jgi:hypothetical protein
MQQRQGRCDRPDQPGRADQSNGGELTISDQGNGGTELTASIPMEETR